MGRTFCFTKINEDLTFKINDLEINNRADRIEGITSLVKAISGSKDIWLSVNIDFFTELECFDKVQFGEYKLVDIMIKDKLLDNKLVLKFNDQSKSYSVNKEELLIIQKYAINRSLKVIEESTVVDKFNSLTFKDIKNLEKSTEDNIEKINIKELDLYDEESVAILKKQFHALVQALKEGYIFYDVE